MIVLPSMWRRAFLPVIFLGGVGLAAIWPFFLGTFYGVGDMRDVTIPLEIFFRAELLQGRLPLWHPDVSWGFPVIASAQIGFFYPPLLLMRLLPVWLYLPLTVAGHAVALLIGLWLYLRRHVSPAAALLGSVSFGLSAFLWQHASHLNIFLSVAWLPWQLLVADTLLRQPVVRARAWALLALVLALPFLVGQLQVPFLQAVFIFGYLLFHRAAHPRRATLRAILLASILICAVAAVQILPTLELLRESSRGSDGDFDTLRANQHSFPLYHLPTALFPRFFGTDAAYWGKRLEIEYGIFIGTIPVTLAAWQIGRTIRRRQTDWWRVLLALHPRPTASPAKGGVQALAGGPPRHHPLYLKSDTTFWVSSAVLFFLLALGSLSPFRLLSFEPSLWVFSAPARWLLFSCLSMSILAAYGFDQALQHRAAAAKFFATLFGVLVLLIVGGNIFIYFAPHWLPRALPWLQELAPTVLTGRDSVYYHDKLSALWQSLRTTSVSWQSPYTYLPLAMLAGGAWGIAKRRVHLLILITTFELLLIASTATPTIPWRQILTVPASYDALPESVRQKEARILSLQPAGDTGAWLTNPGSRPDGAARELQRQLLLPLLSAQHGVAGIHWPASLDIQAQAAALEQLDIGTSELNVAQAAARNVGAVVASRSLGPVAAAAYHARSGDVDIYTLAAAPRAELSGGVGQTSYRAVTPIHTQVTVESPCDCALVVRDSWFPGWHALLDGQEVELRTAEGIFREVTVPPGRHTIDFFYRPPAIPLGIGLTTLGALTCLFLLLPFRARLRV